jgi:hypothetical protein
MAAFHALHQLERQDAARNELAIAQLTTLTANLNRDPKHRPEPFKLLDFCLFRQEEEDDGFPPEAAAVAVALQATRSLPSVLQGAWPAIAAAAPKCKKVPQLRAFRSDDSAVWLLAPVAEGRNWRGLLAVGEPRYGRMQLRDIDRPLCTWTVNLPRKPHWSYIEAGVLVLVERSA